MADHFHANDPGSIPADLSGQATDLREVAMRADKDRQEREERQQALVQVIARRWDNAMQRAFKGIHSRRDRHAMMFAFEQREERSA
jgi:hypothetical protein